MKAGDQYEVRTGNIWNFALRDDVSTCRRLISEGVPPTLCNKVGWTPLHAAAFGGADRVIALLLRESVDIDARCRAGRTPLMDAARGGHLGAVKALAKAGANLHLTEPSGLGLVALAKGEAVRQWLTQRLSPVEVSVSARGGRGRGAAGGGSGRAEEAAGGGKTEARPERQKTGASSKQKAGRLKQKRAEAQANARDAARRELSSGSGSAPSERVAGVGEIASGDSSDAPDAEIQDEIEIQIEIASGDSSDAPDDRCKVSSERDETRALDLDLDLDLDLGVDGSLAEVQEDGRGDAAGRATRAESTCEEWLHPLGLLSSLEDRRRFAYAPLPPAPTTSDEAPGLCLYVEALGAASLEAAASYASAMPSASAGAEVGSFRQNGSFRRVACLVADARHPLVHASPSLYARVRARLWELDSTAEPTIVIVLTKVDLVSSRDLAGWSSRLEQIFPSCRVVPFSSKGKGVGENVVESSGVSSRRRQIAAPLSGAERAACRQYAEAFAIACGIVLPRLVTKPSRGLASRGRACEDAEAGGAVAEVELRRTTHGKGGRLRPSGVWRAEAPSVARTPSSWAALWQGSEGQDGEEGEEGEEEEEGEEGVEGEEGEEGEDKGEEGEEGSCALPTALPRLRQGSEEEGGEEEEEEEEEEDDEEEDEEKEDKGEDNDEDEDDEEKVEEDVEEDEDGDEMLARMTQAASARRRPDAQSMRGRPRAADGRRVAEAAQTKLDEDSEGSSAVVGERAVVGKGAPQADALGKETDVVAGAAEPALVVITLIGLPNSGRSSLVNALTASHVASVSRSPNHTKHIQRVPLAPGVLLRDTPALVITPPSAATLDASAEERVAFHGTGITFLAGAEGVVPATAPAHVYDLCSLTSSSQVREPYSAIRLLAHHASLDCMKVLTTAPSLPTGARAV